VQERRRLMSKSCSCSVFLAACYFLLGGADLKKNPLHPNLNHSVPEVGTKRFDRGNNNGFKTSHALADLGNMMLLPKLAKQRELDLCQSGVFQFWTHKAVISPP
jgi:hypothetical protein